MLYLVVNNYLIAVSERIGNPITLFIERIFWLGIGIFLGLAILLSLFKTSQQNTKNTKYMSQELSDLANKAIQEND